MRFQTFKHKNVVASAVIAFCVLLIAVVLKYQQNKPFSEQVRTAQILPSVQETNEIDTDRDGLADWKEKLYGSDYKNVDTDYDGTKDGEEVRLGRNPVVTNTAGKGYPPNDRMNNFTDTPAVTTNDMTELKKEFFAKYLAEGSKNIKETTFRNLIAAVDTRAFMPQQEIVNLNISSDNSPEAVKTYLNAFGLLIKKYTSNPGRQSEDTVIQNAITQKGINTRTELQLFSVMYKNFAKDLLLLRVPSLLAQAHLSIVNGYEGMGAGLLALGNIQSDPMNGTAGYEAYLKYRLDVTNGYVLIVRYVAGEQISFVASEPGYPFYWNTVANKTAPTE
ncbi:MAG: hypothetical protein A2942_00795 [Candidatus Lloydbacteria bacterium RIFCSPLOWO2_01_FULL_50_20]|uniref:Uncharacterized protein n=1 Tax=Candidatus Lloydbacteria bacterium RIFCSPLOWO2_01_FULL_50_20 TaxID=1798665 RepID=A0A1G2DF90_9BACT|nr:MAG: hypothetical protein A2942_00795 [Candidatus Lloydbacteria bacterium RIFCSPLOWO2_01_FULL_50_20]